MTIRSFKDAKSDEARQFLLDRACERNHPKRHRTKNRTKRRSAKKKSAIKHRLALRCASRAKFITAVRRFWMGESAVYPE